MKRLLHLSFILAVLLISSSCIAQSAHNNDQAFIKVRNFFNEQQADSVYNMTGEGFRTHVSRDVFVNIVETKLFPLGKIRDVEFLSYKAGISNYKVTYPSIVLEMIIGVDKEDRIEALAFKQYVKAVADKNYFVPSSNPRQTDLDKRIDTVARQYINKVNTVGLSIGILKDGKIATYEYGETKRDNKQLPGNKTIFEIGSVTKTFTATLLAWYVNEKKLSLSDPITKYLPDSVAANPAIQSITVQMLSNHTSGLPPLPDNLVLNGPDSLNPYKYYSKDMMYSWLKTCSLQSKPGEAYAYSNFATALLGNILEDISHKSYEQMVREIICKPLNMQNTILHLTTTQEKDFVHVYNEEGNSTPAWDFVAFAPAGALHSTVSDLLLYAQANMKNGTDKLSKAMSLTHKITYDKTPKVALGWHIMETANQPIYWHNGGTYGSSSYLAFQPSRQIAVVILSNSAESVDPIALNILRLLQ
ncbi:MAG: beta-lactamase family protein [Bacteroidetes bacterium]|nr:beta-lactamase family protein [Bacteroidota bacterium]